jgi:DNA polymerase-1
LQGVPVSDAKEYVEKYFQRYPGVLDYMEATKAQAAADGYKPIAELIDPEA